MERRERETEGKVAQEKGIWGWYSYGLLHQGKHERPNRATCYLHTAGLTSSNELYLRIAW